MSVLSSVSVRRPSRLDRAKAQVGWLSALLLLVILVVWEAAVRMLDIPAIVLPTPIAVFEALGEGLGTGSYLPHIAVTFTEIICGFLAGAGLGIALGILIGQSLFLERLLYPYVVAFQTVPKVAIAPIIVIWFGYGLSSKVIITAAIAFFPLLANTIVGLRSAPTEQIDMLRAHTATEWQIFRMSRLPQALPFIFVGLDVAIVLSVIGAIVGEFVGAKEGLGFLILQKNFNFDMAGVFAILLVLSLIGVGLHLLMTTIQRRVLFWANSNQIHVTGL
ncbi:ABC transporter permease [Reyranella soli]|jgi:NitT/TauT family transport system permease protein|uniref:ABC transporter permease n=1 Tax=Reyranella soli TaxID=1230389 RepID=A0A512NE02_9HYPH|nr:ABC transporter permease [Reyranella soli]GEP57152.1 ABC transporter permease [Reyranella soli]